MVLLSSTLTGSPGLFGSSSVFSGFQFGDGEVFTPSPFFKWCRASPPGLAQTFAAIDRSRSIHCTPHPDGTCSHITRQKPHKSILSTHPRPARRRLITGAFQLYDINQDGYITYDEMLQIVRSIYKMTGQMVRLPEDEDTPEKVGRSSRRAFDDSFNSSVYLLFRPDLLPSAEAFRNSPSHLLDMTLSSPSSRSNLPSRH